MSLLDEVNWDAAHAALIDLTAADESVSEAARWHVRWRSSLLSAPHMSLAVRAGMVGADGCVDLLARPVGAWLHQTALVAMRCVDDPLPVPVIPTAEPGVIVDARLAGARLPCLPLAGAHARAAGRPLVVWLDEHPRPGTAGRCATDKATGLVHDDGPPRLVPIDLVRLAPNPPGLTIDYLRGVWRHELSHILDPHPGGSELFAETLALLLGVYGPTTPDEAAPLVERVIQACPPLTVAGLTTMREATGPSVDDELPVGYAAIVAFSRLPLGEQ